MLEQYFTGLTYIFRFCGINFLNTINDTMKPTFSSFLLLFALSFSLFGQNNLSMPQSPSAPSGTSLGANETIAYNGIALGNRVKMRGYVDFIYGYGDLDDVGDDARFSTAGDVDFLFDFSPVTGEVHLAATTDDISLEQAFARYSFNQDFNLSFGRQITNLSYEDDEAPNLNSVSKAYFLDVIREHDALSAFYSELADYHNTTYGFTSTDPEFLTEDDVSSRLRLRRNYVDGVKLNFNNGMFGLSLGVHDGYWLSDDFNDNVALDLAASVMIIPGLEARLGYAHQNCDDSIVDDIGQFNAWIEYNPGDLTLALEFDHFNFGGSADSDLWDLMFLANYQFLDWFGATLRYSHEDFEDILGFAGTDYETDRITLALLFSVTDNFGINFEYSHTELEFDGAEMDADEVYLEGLYTF